MESPSHAGGRQISVTCSSSLHPLDPYCGEVPVTVIYEQQVVHVLFYRQTGSKIRVVTMKWHLSRNSQAVYFTPDNPEFLYKNNICVLTTTEICRVLDAACSGGG